MPWLAPAAAAVAFHVGGIPTQARFTRPIDLGELADASATITWTDLEQDMTGVFDFYFQETNVRPAARVDHPDFAGTLFAADVPVLSPDDQLLWDTSTVAAGSYFVYEITDDLP